MSRRGCGKRPKKIVGKRPKPVCWKTTETFWVVGKWPKPSCWKTAEISAVFQQSHHIIVDGLFSAVFKQLVVVVRKRQKFLPFSNKIPTKWLMVCFLPFSNNHSKLLENGPNFCNFPTIPPLKCWWYLSAIFKHQGGTARPRVGRLVHVWPLLTTKTILDRSGESCSCHIFARVICLLVSRSLFMKDQRSEYFLRQC